MRKNIDTKIRQSQIVVSSFISLMIIVVVAEIGFDYYTNHKKNVEKEVLKEEIIDSASIEKEVNGIKDGSVKYTVLEEGDYYGVHYEVTASGILILSGTDELNGETYSYKPWNNNEWHIYGSYVKIQKARTFYELFSGLHDMVYCDLSETDTSKVTDMTYMFYGCGSMEYIDLSYMDTSNVISMQGMFEGCRLLKELDISSFNTSKVEHMGCMFWGAGFETVDVSSFDTSQVTDMGGMFLDCWNLKELDLSNFDTRNVSFMGYMFGLEGIMYKPIDVEVEEAGLEKLDISSFDTSNVDNMNGMFYGQKKLKNFDLRHFDTSNVVDFSSMFGMTDYEALLDLSGFDMSNAGDIENMFQDCNVPEILVNGTWPEELVDDTVFAGCSVDHVTIKE